jgi:hypothetical protein
MILWPCCTTGARVLHEIMTEVYGCDLYEYIFVLNCVILCCSLDGTQRTCGKMHIRSVVMHSVGQVELKKRWNHSDT